jgi:hypothetical protein
VLACISSTPSVVAPSTCRTRYGADGARSYPGGDLGVGEPATAGMSTTWRTACRAVAVAAFV